jgi:hypothetical protein
MGRPSIHCRSVCPFEQTHHDEGRALVLAEFADGADVRMIKSRSRQRLSLPALERHSIAGHLVRQKLHRRAAAELDILGSADDAHAASAQLAEQPIVSDGLACADRPC